MKQEVRDVRAAFVHGLILMKAESTLSKLYSRIGQDWHQQDDIVTPFNDRRWSHVGAVWTFDLDRDILYLDKSDRKFCITLDTIRQRSITIADLEPRTIASPLREALQIPYSAPYWRMRRKNVNHSCLQRRKSFITRILSDFAFQWRHVLSGDYNNFTFRRLAYAIIKIFALDFGVREVTLTRPGLGGFLVWTNNLPEWDYPSSHIIRFGDTSVVLCQHAQHAVSLIAEDHVKRSRIYPNPTTESFTYLILSVREVVLCRRDKEGPRYTEPYRLLDGKEPPSDEAIELLLHAIQPSCRVPALHKMPIELQDAILAGVSAGPIERARMGCLLDAGSNFGWSCGGRTVEREIGRRFRGAGTPVESHIQVDGHDTGVAYK